MRNADALPEEIARYYDRSDERARLLDRTGRLERERTQEILERYLPPPPARVIDVGGGAGIYARWLAEKGYDRDFGARPLARVIETELKDRLADDVLFGALSGGGRVQVDVAEDGLVTRVAT